jgi:Ca2+/Na+ antiporter
MKKIEGLDSGLNPTRELNVVENNYDLSVIQKDKLQFLLKEALTQIEKIENVSEKIKDVEDKIKSEERYTKYRQRFGITLIALGCFGWAIYSSVFKATGGAVFFAIVCVIALFVRIIYRSSDRKRKTEAIYNIETYEHERKKIENEVATLYENSYALFIIPDNYCYKYAISKMLEYFNNYRADNWKEAVSLYE